MAKTYKIALGFKDNGLATREDFLEENEFANCSKEELKELFDQFRFFCNNGYTPEGSELDEARKKICAKIPYGVVAMQTQLLEAIAVKFLMENED